MKRRNSKAKVLALAAMCAIFSGGYSGLNPVYADSLTIKLPDAGSLKVGGDGNVTGTITIADYALAKVLEGNISNLAVTNGGITLGTLANNVQAITYTASTSGASAKTTIDSDTIINGAVTAKDKLTLGHTNDDGSYTSGSLDYKEMGQLSQLLNSTIDGQKTVIDAGDKSKVGGVGFNAGAVTGVKSINADDRYAKFRVMEDDNNYTFRAGNFMVTTGKENDSLNGDVTFYDTNREGDQHITISEMVATRDKIASISHFSGADSSGNFEGTSIEGKLKVYKDGKVTIDGKLTAGSDSKIGNITISDGQLSTSYSGAEGGIARVNVTDLYDDHKIITEDTTNTYSSKNVKLKIDSLEQSRTNLGEKIEKIERFTNNDNNKQGTSIARNFDVYDDGTVIINDGQTQQVTIDSNGIKVGTGSAYINNEGFKAGADGKNSLTTSGLTAKEIQIGDNTEFFVDGGGNVVANGTLSAAGSKFFVSSDGDMTARGFLSVAGDKFRVNADGSINANNKFIVDANGALRASDDKFTADKDGNVRAVGSLSAAGDKFQVGTDGSINVNQKFIVDADGTISSEGRLSVAGGKFVVDENGVVTAGSVKMDADGKLTSASGSKIGDVTIDGESLSNGANSIKVSELASDHALINDATKGNENLHTLIGQAQSNIQDLDGRTKGISRNNAVTTIESTLQVGSDGTVTINKDDTEQVIINSDGFKVGTDGKNSFTSTGLTAQTIYAGINNTEFTVDENGNVIAKGTLSAADGKFNVDTDGTLTTKKLITDELVITGSGAAGGTTGGSIAFGGSGTIKSNIKEGTKETTFETTVDKVNTKVTDGTNTTTVTTTASGTTFTKGTDSTNSPNTTIDGSTITSKNGTATGTLDGGNLTLEKGSSKTDITAGGATFTKDDKTTTIDGGNISAAGTLSVAGGKFTVGADGSFSAAGGNFKIDNTGTMTAGSIKMDKIEAADDAKGIDVGGVILKDKSITAAEGKFKVDADGKVIINEGTKNQVKIDSNGIKVGNNSAFISDDGFKSSGDLYIGTKTAPTENATDARFYVKGSDGSVKAADGKFTVEADGGFTAADGKFKVTGDGNLEVKDAAGNSKSINLSDVADMGQDIARMNNRISDVSDRVNKVGAMSAALASLKTIGYAPEAPTEFSVGLGQYKGESGVALGIFHYPNKNFLLNLSLSTAGGETMGGIGATWRIGHGAQQKQLEVAIKEDVEKVIVKKEDYEALQEQVNQLTQIVQQLVADKEAAAAK